MKKTKRKRSGSAKASVKASAKASAGASAKTPELSGALKGRLKKLEALRIPYIIALCVVLFLGWWRLSSRPIAAILGTERFIEASALSLHLHGGDDTGAGSDDTGTGSGDSEPGSGSRRTWTLQASAPEGEAVIAGLLEILDSTRYRPDMGDLQLLQSDYRVNGTGPVSVEISLLGEDGQARTILFHEADTMRTGGKRFHPVDVTVLDRLAAYVEEHGMEQEAERGVEQEAERGVEKEAEQGMEQEAEQGVEQEAEQGVEKEAEHGVEQEAEQGVEKDEQHGVEQEADYPAEHAAPVGNRTEPRA